MIKNIIIGWYRYLKGYTSKEVRRRNKICSTCEFKNHKFCMKCGCFLPAKQRVDMKDV